MSDALIVHLEEAERQELPHGGGFVLLADASQTHGALGANVLNLSEGADGAHPHLHKLSTEVFHVVEGKAQFFLDGAMTTVDTGGFVSVPPGMPHAFGAAPGSATKLYIVLTPGIDRFGFFRSLSRIERGLEPFENLVPDQERYDVHFLDDAAWTAARSR